LHFRVPFLTNDLWFRSFFSSKQRIRDIIATGKKLKSIAA